MLIVGGKNGRLWLLLEEWWYGCFGVAENVDYSVQTAGVLV